MASLLPDDQELNPEPPSLEDSQDIPGEEFLSGAAKPFEHEESPIGATGEGLFKDDSPIGQTEKNGNSKKASTQGSLRSVPKGPALSERKAGRLLMCGWEGADPSELISLVEEVGPAGVIYFRRNWPGSPEILTEALEEAKRKALELTGKTLLVALDNEGGSVLRLPPPYPQMPSAQEQARIAKEEGLEALSALFGQTGKALSQAGFNLNLAPVLDLTQPDALFIGDRSYGSNPSEVARLAQAFIQGFLREGLLSCAKHFPGLGSAMVDPHLDLPMVEESLINIWERHVKPFREAMGHGLELVMTSHAIYSALDRLSPVTFSQKAIKLLKKDCGFKGLALSDDLEMGAISKYFSTEEAALSAVAVGHDLALIWRYRRNILAAREALAAAIHDSRLEPLRVSEAKNRLARTLRLLRGPKAAPSKAVARAGIFFGQTAAE